MEIAVVVDGQPAVEVNVHNLAQPGANGTADTGEMGVEEYTEFMHMVEAQAELVAAREEQRGERRQRKKERREKRKEGKRERTKAKKAKRKERRKKK